MLLLGFCWLQVLVRIFVCSGCCDSWSWLLLPFFYVTCLKTWFWGCLNFWGWVGNERKSIGDRIDYIGWWSSYVQNWIYPWSSSEVKHGYYLNLITKNPYHFYYIDDVHLGLYFIHLLKPLVRDVIACRINHASHPQFLMLLVTDIKTEYDPSGMRDGMDYSQQALLKGSQDVGCLCGYWCGYLHCNWCQSQCQRFYMCHCSSVVNIIATNCEYTCSITCSIGC